MPKQTDFESNSSNEYSSDVSQDSFTANRKYTTLSSTSTSTSNGRQGSSHNIDIYGTAPLLYCVICLLVIITVLLLVMLLKNYCKKRNENMPDSNIEGGTFRMSDHNCNSDLDNPNDDIISHSNNLVIYTPCSDDSSSTSSESLCHSYGDKNNDNNQQYLSLKTTLQSPDYENVPEGKSASTLDCENKKVKKSRDYVNIQEQGNMPLTKGRRSKTESHQADQDESQTSSESSSDDSDDDSVNYSTVVFKEAPNTVQKEQ